MQGVSGTRCVNECARPPPDLEPEGIRFTANRRPKARNLRLFAGAKAGGIIVGQAERVLCRERMLKQDGQERQLQLSLSEMLHIVLVRPNGPRISCGDFSDCALSNVLKPEAPSAACAC
jgi:hypothetical protein